MKWLAPISLALALLSILITHPNGRWYCTVEHDFCDSPLTTDADSPASCCQKAPPKRPTSPCCVEVTSEWQLVAVPTGYHLPEPSSTDWFGPMLATPSFEGSLPGTAERLLHGGNDPPQLPGVPVRTLFSVRLI